MATQIETRQVEEMRCVAVLDARLPIGHAANAAAVMALTMGCRQPQLVGAPLVDGSGAEHPGLVPIGIPVLGAPAADLPAVRAKALKAGLEVVDFPAEGQETTDYDEFRRRVAGVETPSLRYVGVMIFGGRKQVSRIVGRYRLLRDDRSTG
ncbi:MAG TPA: DUF2000 domain-containing protein [Kaistiaceae bacterium]|nr:DUF2000 domain-containing protein [Kaistiaceae bacterium]